MKKSELKNIIKECVKEVIFEEGVLSGIITEVATGLVASNTLLERQAAPQPPAPRSTERSHAKKEVLSAIARNSYDEAKKKFSNPELFEGTVPIPSGNGKGALAGVSPGDAGVDLNNIPGMGNWAAVASGNTRK